MKKMKEFKILIQILLALATLSACDAPRDRRASFNTTGSSFSANNSTSTNSTTNTTSTNTTSTTSTTSTSSNNNPQDVSTSCAFSSDGTTNYQQSSTHAGNYNLCKSTSNDNVFYFQIKTPPTDASGNSVQLCFIPMTTSGSNSIYIGNPMCGYFTNNTTIKKLTFIKYSAYSNATITSIMFFKDTSYYYPAFNSNTNTLNAFQACMNALSYGNSTYCNSFKSVGQYVFQNF